jgi:hypothetical protein
MTFTKHMILGGAVIGLIAFFLPLISAGGRSASALDIFKGMDSVKAAVDTEVEHADADMRKAGDEMSKLADEVKGYIAIMFAPLVLCAAIGGVAQARKKLGRLGGLGALLFGLVSAFLSLVLLMVAQKDAASGSPGIGLWLAVLGSCAATVGGLLALIKPDRGGSF